jgi:hypothetical protein
MEELALLTRDEAANLDRPAVGRASEQATDAGDPVVAHWRAVTAKLARKLHQVLRRVDDATGSAHGFAASARIFPQG